jgi:pilus assembly protein FimV
MVAKRSLRALALLLALPSAAFALGLGDIRLLSPLNAPLDAEVELVDVAPDEMNTLQAQLASRETFARYGLEWPAYLAGVQVRPVRTPDGREILKLKSTEAISEPFMTLLVEVSWAKGHLVREYTMLLDPPVYTPGQSAVASAPVIAPTTGGGTREGAIARSAEAPAAATVPAPESEADSPPTIAAAAPAAAAPAAPSPARSAPEATSSDSAIGPAHVVQRGETLSGIASAAAAARPNSARTDSYMVAIYQANPRAFEQNMNILRSGALLRIPNTAQAAEVSPVEAAAEIRRQYAAWRSATGTSTASSSEQPGRLKLVAPSESASVGTSPGASSAAEVSRLEGQVKDLEGQLAESKRLLELKNAELARMQAELAAKQAKAVPPPQPAPPPAPPVAAPPPVAKAPPPVEKAPEAQPAPPPPAPIEEKPAPPPVAQAPAPTPEKVKPAPVPLAPEAGGSILDTLMDYWWAIALVLGAVVAAIAVRIVRAQRAAQFDDSLGRLAVAGAEAVDAPQPSRGFASGGFASADTQMRDAPVREAPRRGAEPVELEPNFVVEESGTHERARLSPVTAAAPARHVTADETISSETAINLDQGDPLAEADFHMAYGLYDQAADLIRIAISREPARRDLKLKLLEVFFVWGNKEQFLQTARDLADSRDEAAPGEWEKILIMGKQLAPEDPLFSGAGAVAGATAGGVDLDLEGGQSRVDFDLLGEPVAGAAGQTVDLDIGSAVGDQADLSTGVTDENAALSGFGTAQTTRQMTARLRQDMTQTTEIEGPTVEQPAFDEGTIRQKVETALRQSAEQTAELALDDLGLDVGQADTVDQPGVMEEAGERAKKEETGTTGAWQFDQDELLTQTSLAIPDASPTARLAALGAHSVDVDIGEASSTHPSFATGEVDLDVGAATGSHAGNGGHLDVDVGAATMAESTFAATQRLASEDLALPDLEPVTMSEVGTKLDLARAYMDMGDPDGARNILEEVLAEGSAAQKQEAQRLMESLPG